jgi:hypothetical protein
MLLENLKHSLTQIAPGMGSMDMLKTKRNLAVIPFLVDKVAYNCHECLVEGGRLVVKCN